MIWTLLTGRTSQLIENFMFWCILCLWKKSEKNLTKQSSVYGRNENMQYLFQNIYFVAVLSTEISPCYGQIQKTPKVSL